MKPAPHSNSHVGARTSQTSPDLPDGTSPDRSQLEEDLAESPEEKRNATDGYAPADDADLEADESAGA